MKENKNEIIEALNELKDEKNVSIKDDNKETKKGKNILIVITIIVIVIIALGIIGFGFLVIENSRVKPIIYLYPTQQTEVKVDLKYPQDITVSYPKYNNGWRVLSEPNGNMTDLDSGRNLYSLYYESSNNDNFRIEKEGFCIKGNDTVTFLEEKLAKLGLNERESEEFIIYWLPILEKNKYNYIRFASFDEINNGMPLEITPKPDTLIRVLMIYQGLNNPIDVTEQKIVTPERNGFVAVEWGGTKIK